MMTMTAAQDTTTKVSQLYMINSTQSCIIAQISLYPNHPNSIACTQLITLIWSLFEMYIFSETLAG